MKKVLFAVVFSLLMLFAVTGCTKLGTAATARSDGRAVILAEDNIAKFFQEGDLKIDLTTGKYFIGEEEKGNANDIPQDVLAKYHLDITNAKVLVYKASDNSGDWILIQLC